MSDLWLLQTINHWIASSRFLSLQAILFNNLDLPDLLVASSLVAIWFSKERHPDKKTLQNRQRALLIFIAFIPTYLIARTLQKIFLRQRPLVEGVPLDVVGDLQTWNTIKAGFSHFGSFPSDHAAMFFVFTAILFSLNQKLGLLSLGLSLYFSFLRIGMGYHWPSDILGGAMLGTLVAVSLLYCEPGLKKFLDRSVTWIESHQKWFYPLSFLVLADYANGFNYLATVIYGVTHFRVFH